MILTFIKTAVREMKTSFSVFFWTGLPYTFYCYVDLWPTPFPYYMSTLLTDDSPPLYIFERFFVLYTFIIHRVRKYYLQGSLNYFNKYLAWYWTVQASNSITHNWWLVKLPLEKTQNIQVCLICSDQLNIHICNIHNKNSNKNTTMVDQLL